jgi:chromosome segregation ATPase
MQAMRKSRCYAYVAIPSQPPVLEIEAASDAMPVVESKKKVAFLSVRRAKAIGTPEKEDTRAQDRQRIEQLQQKLNAIETSKAAEIQAIREAVQREKSQLDEEVRESVARATLDGEKLRKNRLILAGLKKENDKIRATNQMMAKNNHNLRLNTERLDESLKTTTQLYDRLVEHHKKEAQTHEKLEKKCRQLEQSIQWMQYQVEESTEYARRQSIRKGAYEEAFVALVPHLALNGHPDLARQVRNLYESATGTLHVDHDWTKFEADTCSGTVSSTDLESESEHELYAVC